MTQSIEVVVPVHDPARPVARGIASVLDQRAALAARGVDLHVTVVLHNLAADSVSGPGFQTGVDGVTYLSHSDGVASPAAPATTPSAAAARPTLASSTRMTTWNPVRCWHGGRSPRRILPRP
ncbi:hypothetical protein PJ267_21055 [Arthrobacter sp. OVS8]|nr:hypothetical protein PJ267_21055 [Arthrobacter sp. OVS8]